MRRMCRMMLLMALLAPCAFLTAPRPAGAQGQDTGGRVVRTESGERYYLDDKGVLHRIVREARDPGGVEGIFYYLEDDDRPVVERGPAGLYYLDASGRLHPVESMPPPPPRPEPYTVIPGSAAKAPPAQPCSAQVESCLAGCRGISPRQAADRPNCLAACEEIRRNCKDR
ncbi:hypothetical protein [Fundidesulfovibrio agrisoli]|uniref:hypothetical protein n=1 Tax=Fundidesulfovibrio agrisoli TaxID=2922717 RepID=UPI001FABD1F7|nr:hypothetical protein [Fundidesulfovibrio agrisoli]